MKSISLLKPLLILVFVATGGCSDSSSDDGGSSGGTGGGGGGTGGTAGTGGTGGGGDPAPYPSLVWDYREVDVDDPTNPAGVQGKLMRGSDGTIYYAYYKYVEPNNICDIAPFSGGPPAPSVNYELRMSILEPGETDWTTPEVVPLGDVGGGALEYVTSLFGLDGTIEAATDTPVLAMSAGASGLAACGSSDLVIARRSAGGTWSFESPVTDSSACCSADICGDAFCVNGTDVGAWAAITESPAGELAVTYTDYHNFWDQDGQSMQGYEMWEEAGGVTGVRPWQGVGNYPDIVYSGEHLITALTTYNGTDLWVLRRDGSAGTPDDWTQVLLIDGVTVGERISLAVGDDGVVGMAYHERLGSSGSDVHDLKYCESTDDGATWSACQSVDNEVWRVGYYPSLAFDNENRPVIAYRFCGTTDCENANDGLRMAWREHSGEWNTLDVHDEDTSKSGLYNSLVLDPDTNEPVIVFHNQTRGAAVAARGQFL